MKECECRKFPNKISKKIQRGATFIGNGSTKLWVINKWRWNYMEMGQKEIKEHSTEWIMPHRQISAAK